MMNMLNIVVVVVIVLLFIIMFGFIIVGVGGFGLVIWNFEFDLIDDFGFF